MSVDSIVVATKKLGVNPSYHGAYIVVVLQYKWFLSLVVWYSI